MRSLSRVPVLSRGRLFRLLSVALVAVFLAPYGVGMIAQARAGPVPVTPALVSSVTGNAFWNGVNINNYPSVSSAASWSFSTIATMNFTWAGPLTGPGVSQAFLVILFLGFPAYTKQQVLSSALPAGSISMTYDLTQFKWYLQGVYELHAYLEDPAGNSMWSENFYVRVAQPYDVVVATIGLILLTIAELYMIATVGPRAADKARKPPKAASKEPPAVATESPPVEKS